MIIAAPWWHPHNFAHRHPNLIIRQRVLNALRSYFAQQDFAEVETPILQISPGNEVHLQAFKTEFRDPHGGPSQPFYLHTSPEFAMKKLLVAGVPRLYQFAHTFRNAERSGRHHPEFTMLEWYRANADTKALMQDCITLIRTAATISNRKTFTYNDISCDPFDDWECLSVAESFQRYADIDLLATADNPQLLASQAHRLNIRTAPDDAWDDIVFRIMAEKVEPFLGKDRPTFLTDYPISMAALARPNAQDARTAERFELYISGLELANAFGELTDPDEQERRFKADMDLKEKLYGERFPIDPDFLMALRFGMAESAGIALGFDRLVMLCTGSANIEDVLWAPVATST